MTETTASTSTTPREYLSRREVALALGVGVGAVTRLLLSGRLAGFKVGRRWRVRPEALRALERSSGTQDQRIVGGDAVMG